MNILPKFGEIWRHIRTGKHYVILCLCRNTVDTEVMVVYYNVVNETWCRPLSQFTDGRFELCGGMKSSKAVPLSYLTFLPEDELN